MSTRIALGVRLRAHTKLYYLDPYSLNYRRYVHAGFLKFFDSIKYTILMSIVSEVLNTQVAAAATAPSSSRKVVFVGHSLGGAAASLAAAATLSNFGGTFPVECHTFGSPQGATPG